THLDRELLFVIGKDSDAAQVHGGNPSLPGLKKLTLGFCWNLNSEISRILPTLEAFQRVLDQQISPGIGRSRSQVSACSTVQSMSFRLEHLTKLLHSIEEKAKSGVFETVGFDGGRKKSLIPPTFEVKSESMGICTKMFLKVDVEMGRLYFKKSKEGPEDKYFVQILQLVKSQKMPAKLTIVLETEREKNLKKELNFYDAKKREGFCQLLQQLKNKHSAKPDPDMITVFVGTWNMGNAGPPHNIRSWFQCQGQGRTRDDTADHIPHDLYVIGTQEDPLGEREWSETVKNTLRLVTDITFKVTNNTVPFSLVEPGGYTSTIGGGDDVYVKVQNPLEATDLELDRVHYRVRRVAEAGLPGAVLQGLSGERAVAKEETEELLKVGATVTGFGELVLEAESKAGGWGRSVIRLQAPRDGRPYVLVATDYQSYVARHQSSASMWKSLAVAGSSWVPITYRSWGMWSAVSSRVLP
ncbi:hypothetical protein CRUP_031858, partial [Coryphaenoides rupestris]